MNRRRKSAFICVHVVLSYVNVLLASRSFKARDTDSKNRFMRKSLIRVQKRSQYFINAHDEPLSVAAMRVSDKTVCPVLGGLLAVQKGSEYFLFECQFIWRVAFRRQMLVEDIRLMH